MTFEQPKVDFGDIILGNKRTHTFQFTNSGDLPLSILTASACDCTTLDYPVHQIAPGGRGEIQAVFDSTEEDLGRKVVDITIVLEQNHPITGYPLVFEVEIIANIIKT